MDEKNAISNPYYGEGYISLQKYSSRIREMFSRFKTEQKHLESNMLILTCLILSVSFATWDFFNFMSSWIWIGQPWCHFHTTMFEKSRKYALVSLPTKVRTMMILLLSLGKNSFMIDHVLESVDESAPPPPQGVEDTQQMFIRGGSARGLTPYSFMYHFSQKKIPLSYTFYWKMVPLTNTLFRALHPF